MRFVFLLALLAGCSSIPLKKAPHKDKDSLKMSLISGNLNVEGYKTKSEIKVYINKTESKKVLVEDKMEKSDFRLNRKVLNVDAKGRAQIKYWVTNLNGEVDLPSMGFPPTGKALFELVDDRANVLIAKDVPEESIFYMPKISIPESEVAVGEEWSFKKRWRSLKTGWPFELNLVSKLKSWYDCGGARCAHIEYKGYVKIPKDSPVSEGVLISSLSGEFLYSPVGHQFIWSSSESQEDFISGKKEVRVRSCTTSYQISPDKESSTFKKKFDLNCN